ncbi:g7419 [Coccomyxa viridis]|uniref:G7419 protein n=1 Tax=Coccomyxa viridis TaxID=1274662 RepID=A0ABP1FXT0_9CHLO
MKAALFFVLSCSCAATGSFQIAIDVPETLGPAWHPAPGQRIPYGFSTPTLNGNFTLEKSLPVIIFSYEPTDAFLRSMWTSDSSVLQFIREAPSSVHYLFTSYGLDALGDVTMMSDRLQWAMDELDLKHSERKQWLSHLHFAKLPLSGLSDVGANFIPYLMGRWRASKKVLSAVPSGSMRTSTERLDASWDWLPAPPPHSAPLQFFANGCTDIQPYDLDGKVALIIQDEINARMRHGCSYAHMISAAQVANASGVLFSPLPGHDVEQMACHGAECDLPLAIWASMVPRRTATAIAEDVLAGVDITLSFAEEDRPGYFAIINADMELAELGWVTFPKLMHLGWAAQWLEYEGRLKANLSRPALEVPIFKNQIMQGEQGVVAHVTLPHMSDLSEYDKLELDFTLGCPGSLDADCPIWDHVVQLFVCCEDPDGRTSHCDKCDVTPWMSMAAEDPAGQLWLAQNGNRTLTSEEPCGRELGRWITPFRRRVGRWLTDVTVLSPLLSSRQCRFQAQTAPWALPWKPSLSLRFTKDDRTAAVDAGKQKGKVERRLIPLFTGGTFDADFNGAEDRRPVSFATPEDTERAYIEAVITGHGSDENNCAEFCVTNHRFRVNGRDHWVNFTAAGTKWGCTYQVEEGGIPNEHGTWHFGRNGWCDGQNVRPWVVDVTKDLEPAQSDAQNVVEYLGLFEGHEPDPGAAPGYIMMQSSLALEGSFTQSTAPQVVS